MERSRENRTGVRETKLIIFTSVLMSRHADSVAGEEQLEPLLADKVHRGAAWLRGSGQPQVRGLRLGQQVQQAEGARLPCQAGGGSATN